jgi:hypothetical protein
VPGASPFSCGARDDGGTRVPLTPLRVSMPFLDSSAARERRDLAATIANNGACRRDGIDLMGRV